MKAGEKWARQAAEDQDYDDAALTRERQAVILLIMTGFLVTPTFQLFPHYGDPAKIAFLLPGVLIFIALASVVLITTDPAPRSRAGWARVVIVVVLGIALFAVGGWNWIVTLAFAGAAI